MLTTFGTTALSEIAAAQQHAHEAVHSASQPALGYLDATSAADIDALTSQIIPTDDTPGAREAGVIYFIDRALATFDRDKRAAYQAGLAAVQTKRKELFPHSENIAGLNPA